MGSIDYIQGNRGQAQVHFETAMALLPGREQEWLVLQLNQDFIGSTLIPGILNRYLGEMGKLDYDADVVLNGNPSVSIYRSPSTRGDGATWKPDGTCPVRAWMARAP